MNRLIYIPNHRLLELQQFNAHSTSKFILLLYIDMLFDLNDRGHYTVFLNYIYIAQFVNRS